MSIQLCIVILYIILLFAISFYVKRRASQNPTEYLFAGRQFSTGLVAVSITGMAVGAASTVGVAESATKIGLAAGWYNAAWAIGAIIMGFVAAGKYRSLNCTTIPELFERSYDKKARIISVIGLSLIMICITSLQYVAGGSILHALMPDIFSMHAGMITSAVVFVGITAIGGLWSSGLSNILSVTVIYLGILYSLVRILLRDGGISGINAALPAADFNWFSPMGGLSFAVLLGWIIVMTTQAITAQGPVQIACGAKNAKAARRGFILGGLLIFPVGFLSAILGLAAKAQFPGINPTMALPQIIMSLDPFSSGMTLAALWAADVSTACTILLGAGTLWLAFNAVGIVKVMLIGLSLTTAFTLVFLCTMFCPSLCRKNTAFWTTLVGIIGLFAWQLCPQIRVLPHVIYFEWIICIITLLVVRLIDKTPIKMPELKE